MAWANDETARWTFLLMLSIRCLTVYDSAAMGQKAFNENIFFCITVSHTSDRRIWGACEGNQRRADKAFLQA